MTDQQLLRDYAEEGSEIAFAELVRRHTDMVYSVALRTLRNPHQAEEVAQGVFVALAHSARRLAKREVLSGWLYATAHHLAAKAVRTEVRRRAREQESVAMNQLFAENDVAWQEISPHFDKAVSELSESDRDALALRYFERKSAGEIAEILGISAQAAQKRVNRAVERLRALFARRGLAIGATGIVVLISANAVEAAPPGLVEAISAGATVAGAPLATATTATATKAFALTTLQKSFVTAAVVLMAGAGIYKAGETSRPGKQVLSHHDQEAAAILTEQRSLSEPGAMASSLAVLKGETNSLRQSIADLSKLRPEIARPKAESEELARLTRPGGQTNASEAELQKYFESPVDPAILAAYKLLKSGELDDVAGQESVTVEKVVPVDAQLDSLLKVLDAAVRTVPLVEDDDETPRK